MANKFKFKSKHKTPRINFGTRQETSENIISGHIELFSNKEISIEGCKGVLEYKDNYIKLKLNKGSIVICGENFDISYFEEKNILVKGKIDSIEFCI